MAKIKINNECKKGNFYINEDAECECCGHIGDYEIIYCDGCTWWCLNCANANGDLKKYTKEQINELELTQAKIKLQAFEKEVERLKIYIQENSK